jgi:hypothetical protein
MFPKNIAFAGNDTLWIIVTKELAGGSFANDRTYLVSLNLGSVLSVTNHFKAANSSANSLLTNAFVDNGQTFMFVGGAVATAANSYSLMLLKFD